MSKKHVEVSWECSLCGNRYGTEQEARSCEDRGLAIPEFKELELVDIEEGGKRFIGCIWDCVPEEARPNLHLLPSCYDIGVSLRDCNPWGQPIPDQKPFSGLMANFHRSEIVGRHSVKEGESCPRCNSADIRIKRDITYFPYDIRRGMLKNIELSECGNCDLRFLNDAQSLRIDEQFRQQLGNQKIADTEKLKRESRYDVC